MPSCPNCQTSSDASGFTSGFFLGLVVGGAGGYLLSTEKGKELLSDLKDNTSEKLAELAENPIIAEKLADLEETMKEARSAVEDTSKNAKDKIHDIASSLAEATAEPEKPKKNFFFRGGSPLNK
ncbi:MAG: hypothetical protein ABII80_00905 [bacterium]